ncbi:MAG: FHA domain-containing protein [Phycisphaerales bacterium]|jgi:pSer/pThr/pTyr-binding forkhead associated (FHA) protein|nr:FHA domain-containing protein [Phycisphaerales bacterium]
MGITEMMMELHVINRKTGQLVRAFALGDAADVLIGRDESCDIRLNAPSVSREHCLIEEIDGDLHLRDLDSSGGTLCGGRKIDDVRLQHGLEVEVGPATLRFVED